MAIFEWYNGEVPKELKITQVYGVVFTKDGRVVLMSREKQTGTIYSLSGGTPESLKEKYGTNDYPKYCNYDALEIPLAKAIPSDYDGEMGVPVSFIDKYCPEQFEIIGIGIGELGKQLKITPIPKEIDAILPGHSSVWRLYIMNKDQPIVPYSRIIIKLKRG